MRKWFRVATEGATTDGRKISRQWIEQMAANYDRTKYGARIWMEHWRGLFADGPFKALGDVIALESRAVEDGKLALFAELEPTPALVGMNAAKQKIYSSIEVDPEFSDTGEAYMVGLGVTDSPSSLGTEVLQFSAAKGAASPFSARKQRPDNLFSEGVLIDLDFSDADDPPQEGPKLIDQVKALFSKYRNSGQDQLSAFREDLSEALGEIVQQFAKIEAQVDPFAFADVGNKVAELDADNQALTQKVAAMSADLENLSNLQDIPPRAPATGGTGEHRASF